MSQAAAARAESLLEVNRPEAALQVLSTALAADPSSYQLLCLTSRAHLAAGNAVEARRAAEAAAAANPEGEWAQRLTSLACSELGFHIRAVEAAREAVRLAPTLWQPHARLAMALVGDGQAEPACEAAATAVRLAPDQADTHFALGYAAMAARAPRVAEQEFERTLQLRPDHAAAMNNLAKIRLDSGRLAPAAAGLGAALATNPQLAAARHNIDLVARRYIRRLHWFVIAAYLGLMALAEQDPPGEVSTGLRASFATGAAIAIGLIVIACVVVDRRLPGNLRGYYRTLPRRDSWIGGWLAFLLLALIMLCAMPLVSAHAFSTLVTLTWMTLLVARLVAARGAVHMRRRLDEERGR